MAAEEEWCVRAAATASSCVELEVALFDVQSFHAARKCAARVARRPTGHRGGQLFDVLETLGGLGALDYASVQLRDFRFSDVAVEVLLEALLPLRSVAL